MPLSHSVTLGRSGLRVSPFCLGAMTFGEDLGWGASEQDSRAIIDRYLERGGNFIDTANVYTRGHSEQILGEHLGRHPHKRERVVLATKFFSTLYPGDPNGGGASRKSIVAQLHESLRRLKTDYVDLYWLHCWDRFTPIEETLRALDDLVAQGKVRYVGFSDTPAWKVAQAQTLATLRGWTPLIALQVEYSLLERTVEGELVPMAQELGLGVTPWSPLKAGVLSGKYARAGKGSHAVSRGDWMAKLLSLDKTYDVIEAVQAVAKELGTTAARVALAWVKAQAGVSSVIIGARTLEQLDENLAALDLELGPEHLKRLADVSRPKLNFPHDFLRGVGSLGYGGATINGTTFAPYPNAPKSDAQRY